MRVLVTGAQGQVGHELLRRVPAGFSVSGFGSQDLDISNADQVLAVFTSIKPELVINAAAYTAVDKAETDVERAYAVNSDGVGFLAAAAERLSIPLFHISTDYVFSGDSDKPYTPDEGTQPSGIYGLSKLSGEQRLIEECSRHLILRTSWVFGAHGNNFVKTMLRLGADRETLSVVADQHGGPTSAGSIADTLWALASSFQQEGRLDWGVYHYSGAPACTWYDFANEIFTQSISLGLLERRPQLTAITTAEYPTPAKRPMWSVLDCRKLADGYGLYPCDWAQDLRSVLQQLGDLKGA
ncbi:MULTISPECIES: dTDP-4-dehydrorhamnose reductase [Pseudomonas]|uniref:dTDP-4-dehydrorhamnose reductase n=1 Tax=Pseudomonas izuensis TaxID=2684212 RepID=A0ABM7RMV5_9PSED|nr:MULTISPECIES: dTDP-4-dehydrorhamnose reductase [Pseudomonas]BCX67110.1 dTDP-4-dehydrorhamnose reductase [Pseudomonas izuensis]